MGTSITWENVGGAVVFRFHGNIESEATPRMRQTILQVIREERVEVAVFHLGDSGYIDSMGIGMFVNLHVQQHERVKFIFCDLSEGISRAFGYVKLISFFDIRETLDDVLEDLGLADL